MRSIEVAPERERDIRTAVPVGTEYYVLGSGGSIHLNVRTNDDHLFHKLKTALGAADKYALNA